MNIQSINVDFDAGDAEAISMEVDVGENYVVTDSTYENLNPVQTAEQNTEKDVLVNSEHLETGTQVSDLIVCEDFDAEDKENDWSEEMNPDFNAEEFFEQRPDLDDAEILRDQSKNHYHKKLN